MIYKKTFHNLFEISILLKAIDSILEILGAFFLIFLSPSSLGNFAKFFFQHELIEDPNDIIGNLIISSSSSLSIESKVFGMIFLFSHGIIKLGLIIGLWKKKLWTYIAAEIIFILFAVYQIYRFIFTHSIFLLFLTILDVFVIIFTWIEYKRLKRLK